MSQNDFANIDVFSSITIVDRLGIGGTDAELIFDGKRFPFVDEDGQKTIELTVPKFMAEWLFRKDKHRVWTKPTDTQESQFLPRYAIKKCPKRLVEMWGPEVADDSMIERDPDPNRIEGTDVALYRTAPVQVQRINIPPNEQPRDRLGRRGAVMSAAKE